MKSKRVDAGEDDWEWQQGTQKQKEKEKKISGVRGREGAWKRRKIMEKLHFGP